MPDTDNNQIYRVGVHLPVFEPADPELWFAVADRSFDAAGIVSEQTKFSYAAAHLGLSHGLEVKDLILCPPATNPYTTLKQEFIKRIGTSQATKTKKLLEHEVIGDQKPSQFARRLKDLGGSAISEEVIKTIWLNRLPSLAQAILAAHHNLNLEDLANLADSIVESTKANHYKISEMSTNQDRTKLSSEEFLTQKILQQQAQITILQKEIEAIKFKELDYPRRSADRSRSTSRSSRSHSPRSRSITHQPPLSGICWYHWRFADKATKCRPPCSFKSTSEN